ncbi:MAG: N5-glutamine methyltransferase family protein [Phycisphaerales bacterium]
MAQAAPSPQVWTTRSLLAWMTTAFTAKGLDSPRLCAEILLAHVIHHDAPDNSVRLRLYTEPDREAAPEELAKLRGLVGRALKHEPVQYLTGQAWFFGLPFFVDPRVLIPRPSSETIVETLLQELRRQRAPSVSEGSGFDTQPVAAATADAGTAEPGGTPVPAPIRPIPKRRVDATPVFLADVCTGSGCLGIALAKHLHGARVLMSDISIDALEVAAANAARHNVHERIELLPGDLLAPIGERLPGFAPEGLDALVANPPYIPDHEWEAIEPNVKDHEPHSALRAGRDGMAFVAPLVQHAPGLLRPGGWLLVEIAACTSAAVLEAARGHALLEGARVLKDGDALDRVMVARRRA